MIRFEQVTKRYPDGTTAVDDLSFEVSEGELVTLVGPSGCGKTTTMMMVNRLIEPSAGRILVNGEDIATVDPVRLRRRIGYVIQQVGLFPHRTILDNTATVPALIGWKRAKARARAAELLELVGLDPKRYGPRYPNQLSGGQRQRVGVARALAADPPVLLMDEPFGAVDPVVREQLQDEFLRMQAAVRKTVLLVTHDIEEAVRLGDRIAVYGQGRIEQFDTPGAVLGRPATPYVAEFVGADRGLKRLSVTEIEADDLEQPPVARLDETAGAAAERLRAEGARWAVVLDTQGDLHGWVGIDDLGAGGSAGSDGSDGSGGSGGTGGSGGSGGTGELASMGGSASSGGAGGSDSSAESGSTGASGGLATSGGTGGSGGLAGSDEAVSTGGLAGSDSSADSASTGGSGGLATSGSTGNPGGLAGSDEAVSTGGLAGSDSSAESGSTAGSGNTGASGSTGASVGDHARRMNAWVPVGAPLKQAFGVMLQHDAGWVAVLDGSRFLGVLTPAKLHEALRRSVDADALGVPRGQVTFDSVADA